MLSQRLLARTLGVDAKSVRVEDVELVEENVEIRLRPRIKHRWRCPHGHNRCPGYDPGRERHWRALDIGRTKLFVVARVPRVGCPGHGVVVATVPWARLTLIIEQLAAWCAVEMSSTAASRLLRCTRRTIGQIVARAAADLGDDELLESITRIGIDEISYRATTATCSWSSTTTVVGSSTPSTGLTRHRSTPFSTCSARREPRQLRRGPTVSDLRPYSSAVAAYQVGVSSFWGGCTAIARG